jgi:cytochrome c
LSIDYLPEGKDIAAVVLGHQTKETGKGSLQFAGGQLLIEKNDCKNCHDVERKVNGPSYVDIANRYYKDPYAVDNLSAKVITGGACVWGETAMSAHPDLSREEAEEIVRYILSLAGPSDSRGQMAARGRFSPREHIGREEKGAYVFQASYRDLGREDGTGSLYAKETFLLRYPKLEAESCDLKARGIRKTKAAGASGGMLASDFVSGRYIGFSKIDMTDIGGLRLKFSEKAIVPEGTSLEVRIGGAAGKRIGMVKIAGKMEEINVPLTAEQGSKEVYLILRNEKHPDKPLGELDWIWFERAGEATAAQRAM